MNYHSCYMTKTMILLVLLLLVFSAAVSAKASEANAEFPETTDYSITSEQLDFTITVKLSRPLNGKYYQVNERGILLEPVKITVAFQSDMTDSIVVQSCKIHKLKVSFSNGKTVAGKTPVDVFSHTIPKGDLLEKQPEDLEEGTGWVFTEKLFYGVKLFREKEEENLPSASGKIEFSIPAGREDSPEETKDNNTETNAPTIIQGEDNSDPQDAVVIIKPESKQSITRQRFGYIFAGAGIGAAVLSGVAIILFRRRKRQ